MDYLAFVFNAIKLNGIADVVHKTGISEIRIVSNERIIIQLLCTDGNVHLFVYVFFLFIMILFKMSVSF